MQQGNGVSDPEIAEADNDPDWFADKSPYMNEKRGKIPILPLSLVSQAS